MSHWGAALGIWSPQTAPCRGGAAGIEVALLQWRSSLGLTTAAFGGWDWGWVCIWTPAGRLCSPGCSEFSVSQGPCLPTRLLHAVPPLAVQASPALCL